METRCTLIPQIMLVLLSTRAGVIAAHPDAHPTVEGTPHAKGVVLLRVTFPTSGEVTSVSLRMSRNREEFASVHTGVSRNSRCLYDVSYDGETTTVAAPVVGNFANDDAYFLFKEPGTYSLRWGIGLGDGEVRGFKVYQEIKVERAQPADLAFISRVSAPEFFRRLVGEDVVARLTGQARDVVADPNRSEFRWSIVIRRLLEATQQREPLEGAHESEEAFLRWASTMFDLAREFSESSYAPYAAFYAGGGYVGYLCEVLYKEEVGSKALRQHELFNRAEEALRLAVEHGDSYLRPRAIYQQARLRAIVGDWEEAEDLLTKVDQVGNEGGTMATFTEELRKDIVRLQKRQQQREEAAAKED